VREGKQAVNKFLGIAARSRRELSTTELERALGALDSIGDVVQTDVITRVLMARHRSCRRSTPADLR